MAGGVSPRTMLGGAGSMLTCFQGYGCLVMSRPADPFTTQDFNGVGGGFGCEIMSRQDENSGEVNAAGGMF